MDSHLNDCIQNCVPGKYIFPFMWMHGEPQQIIKEEIEAIYQSGLREFCVESRPYEKFCESEWWNDMEFILKEAKKRDMRVWLLDDKKFPTGFANGWVKKHRELRKVSLRLEYMDVCGPELESAIIANRLKEEEDYVSITAWKRSEDGKSFSAEYINILPQYYNGMIYMDIPEGVWRIFFVIRTYDSIESKKDYIDLLSKDSCMAMIKGVYEPHYVRLKKYFGNVFAGFFFDEPGFHNDELTYRSKLGKSGMLIPWSNELRNILANDMDISKEQILCFLPALWQNIGEITSEIRMAYMNAVSLKAKENFSETIGNWCREHGVLSVGHLIEDMNTHMRLGYGMGHYFRGLEGQDMAGMDIVLGQVNPLIHSMDCAAPVIEECVDSAFFTYTLPKMAASHSHFCEQKKGRAMCEIFGAYGWAEGVPMMKHILDEMLVSGINYFVPHAFSPKFPDSDCPPHFYMRGENPQFPLFGKLMSYMSRCSHLLSGGIHKAQAAILYNAEGEWSGGDYMPMEKLTWKLTRNQIDFDIIPEDELDNIVEREEELWLYQESYKMLLVPYSEFLPRKLLRKLSEMKSLGMKIFFVDEVPKAYHVFGDAETIKYENLIEILYMSGIKKTLAGNVEDREVRIYHYVRDGVDIYAFLNENLHDEWEGKVSLDVQYGNFYDPWNNKIYPAVIENEYLHLHLFAGEFKFFVSGNVNDDLLAEDISYFKNEIEKTALSDLKYQISIWEDSEFHLYRVNSELVNLGKPEYLPRYSGKIQYETEFETKTNACWLSLGKVGETAQVWINDTYCGSCVAEPYCVYIGNAVREGKNELRVEVVNNLAYKERDELSKYFQLPPSGILGPVELYRKKQ